MSKEEKEPRVIVRLDDGFDELEQRSSSIKIEVEFRHPLPTLDGEEGDYCRHRLLRKVDILINGREAPVSVEDTNYFTLLG